MWANTVNDQQMLMLLSPIVACV